MVWIMTAIGILIIVVAGRDILNTLFNPLAPYHLTHHLMQGIWRAFQPLSIRHPGFQPVAGLATLFVVVGTWMVLMVIGWAMIYYPHLPNDFMLSFDYDQPGTSRIVVSLYLSMVTLVTLGFGDIVPTASMLRLITPLQAMIGFGLVTAGISWFLSINPVLFRRRILAYQVTLLRETQIDIDGERLLLDVPARERLIESLTSHVVTAKRDLMEVPVTYYFPDTDPQSRMSTALPLLLQIARWEQAESDERGRSVRTHARMLEHAVDDYLVVIASTFLGMEGHSSDAILRAFVRQH